MSTLFPLWVALSGCTLLNEPVPSTSGDGFFDRPWPDDRRRLADGAVDLSDFPRRGEIEILDDILLNAEMLDGFGNNSPAYVRFARAIDTDRLPSPEASVEPGASVIIVNVDADSPRRGELIPLQWRFNAEETSWEPENLLALAPIWGAPLDAATTYAVVLSTDIASPPDGFETVWRADDPDNAYYLPIQETLFQIGRELDTVAYAFSFTTQDPTAEMSAVVAAIDTWLPRPPVEDQELLEKDAESDRYRVFEGRISVPVWQEGQKPYASEGGGIVIDEDGEPVLFGWDLAAFSLTIPSSGSPPADGWPVAIYSHGTGGDHETLIGGHSSPAALLATEGIAVIGIAQPLHGDRSNGYNPELYTFNYFNPPSVRTVFRQGALDQIWLSRMLADDGGLTFTTEEGLSVPLDPDRVGYIGHSQGAQVGAIAAPYFGDRIRGSVLSSGGAGVSITLTERDAGDIDIQGILNEVLGLESGEEMTTFHPVVGLAQMASEVVDPFNYAVYWHQRRLHGLPEGSSGPASVLQTEGLHDLQTPPRTIESLAGAAGLPILYPSAQLTDIQQVTGLFDEPTPTAGNLVAWDGSTVSGGLAQYPEQDHFAIFYETDAMRLYMRYLSSALSEDVPEIIDIVNND